MAAERVLVVGGGIAGLSCAIAMRRHGCPVDVVELSGDVPPESVNLHGRAVDALADLGVLDDCRARGTTYATTLFGNIFDAAGNRSEVERPQEPHSTLPAAIVIYRPTLLGVLGAAARDAGARVMVPCTVDSIERFADRVVVTFDDGHTAGYDVVVGADGLRSKVRELVWGHDIAPTYTGALGIRWLAGDVPPGQHGFYHAPRHVVVVSHVPENVTYVATYVETDRREATEQEARSLLLDVLSAYSAPYLRMLRDRVATSGHIVARAWDSLWVPEWYAGRVVLIGDAAHATAAYVPAGAGMALIDSVVLAEELAEAENVADGLAAYVHRRQDRVRLAVRTSIDVTRLHRESRHAEANALLADALRTLARPY